MNDWWIIGFPICWLIGYLLGVLERRTCDMRERRLERLKSITERGCKT